MLRIVAQLDKYHLPALAALEAPRAPAALPAPTPEPLALTHQPQLSGAKPARKGTSLGALVVDIFESLTGART